MKLQTLLLNKEEVEFLVTMLEYNDVNIGVQLKSKMIDFLTNYGGK